MRYLHFGVPNFRAVEAYFRINLAKHVLYLRRVVPDRRAFQMYCQISRSLRSACGSW